MLRIRVKMGPGRNKEWTCLFGVHVRTATIMIGLWHLFLNILALGVLAIIIKNPVMMQELENGYSLEMNEIDLDAPALPTPLSKIEPPYAYRDHHTLSYNHNVDMGGLVCICMIAITLMLIYGSVKGKPSHLLPFFCLQLFDFAITTLTAAGYLCYIRNLPHIISENRRLPWREELLKLSPQALTVLVLITFIFVVLSKGYTIGIVWRCYKYLTMRQHNLRSMIPYIIPDVAMHTERDYNTLLPDYEEAIAQSMKQPPPPSYQVAMSSTETDATNPPSASPTSTTTVTGDVEQSPTHSGIPATPPSSAETILPTTTTTTSTTASNSVTTTPIRTNPNVHNNNNNTTTIDVV